MQPVLTCLAQHLEVVQQVAGLHAARHAQFGEPQDVALIDDLGMLDALGFARGVLVQGSAHGRDNSAMLDALQREPARLRGVAVADADVAAGTLRQWHVLGVRALRFNHFFRGGQLHYRGGIPLGVAETHAAVMAELGWHLQLWIDVKDLSDTIPALKARASPTWLLIRRM